MDTVEVTRNAIRITKANNMSAAQINKILQGIKQCYSFPVELKCGGNMHSCICKTNLRRRTNGDCQKCKP